mmetsp:Transcript_47700/g.123692  ORF Transcript_47700/g.123692 Transcript_47700/m.123692 type:complete len:89 (+) Transcript_47700:1253-1519(+)
MFVSDCVSYRPQQRCVEEYAASLEGGGNRIHLLLGLDDASEHYGAGIVIPEVFNCLIFDNKRRTLEVSSRLMGLAADKVAYLLKDTLT